MIGENMSDISRKIREYRDAVLGNAIYDIIKFILITLFCNGITSLIGCMLFDFLNNDILKKYQIPLLFLIIVLTTIVVLEIYTRNVKKIPNIPPVETDYTVIKREICFTYGKEKSKYELILNVKSNIKNLSRIYGKYTWSGSDTATLKCETKHCTLIPLTRKDSYIEYEIELRKNYKKGKQTECKIVGDMPDSKHTFIPFFATQITEETKRLIINIIIPPQYGVREIICEEIAVVRNSNQNSEVFLLDEDGKYTWDIKNPKLFYKYSIRWEL